MALFDIKKPWVNGSFKCILMTTTYLDFNVATIFNLTCTACHTVDSPRGWFSRDMKIKTMQRDFAGF